jgi:short-subunit dehydrogenase involved in D-alanine esterification of teichoic acids
MKSIVITGSTRGIGFGLADSFLARGCQVMISGRQQATIDQAIAELAKKHTGTAGNSAIAGFWSCRYLDQ